LGREYKEGVIVVVEILLVDQEGRNQERSEVEVQAAVVVAIAIAVVAKVVERGKSN
jgi:hypothetical protein